MCFIWLGLEVKPSQRYVCGKTPPDPEVNKKKNEKKTMQASNE